MIENQDQLTEKWDMLAELVKTMSFLRKTV